MPAHCRHRVFAIALGMAAFASASSVHIVPAGNGYQLLRDGTPMVLKGAAGTANLALLAARGANAVRIYSPDQNILTQAQQYGLGVLMGISGDSLPLAQQQVQAYQNDPALLMWAIGNELELNTGDTAGLWQRVNAIATMVHQQDSTHPVITVVAEIGGNKLAAIKQLCPALDAIGINSYAGAGSLGTRVPAAGWTKPFFLTEFGPVGAWESPTTSWDLPIEQTSTEKAALYLANDQSVLQSAQCLGTFAFLWGQKQETTPTWYGMFLADGSPLGAVDAMTYAWSGHWPTNRCPTIDSGKITVGPVGSALRQFQPGVEVECAVDASDPDHDSITVSWELHLDVSADASAAEPPAIAGAVLATQGRNALLQMPAQEGDYRIFVYVKDPSGSAATANVPIQVTTTAPNLAVHPFPVFSGLAQSPTWQALPDGSGKALALNMPTTAYIRLRVSTVSGKGLTLIQGMLGPGRHVFQAPKNLGAHAPLIWQLEFGPDHRKTAFQTFY